MLQTAGGADWILDTGPVQLPARGPLVTAAGLVSVPHRQSVSTLLARDGVNSCRHPVSSLLVPRIYDIPRQQPCQPQPSQSENFGTVMSTVSELSVEMSGKIIYSEPVFPEILTN